MQGYEMSSHREKLDYLNGIARSRGYAHRYQRLLAEHDFDVLRAINPVPVAIYVDKRRLGDGLKELLLIVSFSALRSPRYIVQAHIRKALSFGITGRQALEALELMLPDAGRIAFENGLQAWLDAGADAQPDGPPNEVSPRTANRSGTDKKSASAEEKSTMDYQKILADHDPAITEILERVPREVYRRDRNLDAKTKELIMIVAMTTLKAPEYVLQNHVRKALELGASKEEILEAIELIIPVVGMPTFEHGLMAWADVVGAKGLDPEEGAQFSRNP
jgi:4-carboxymuconolactone decarboxylase